MTLEHRVAVYIEEDMPVGCGCLLCELLKAYPEAMARVRELEARISDTGWAFCQGCTHLYNEERADVAELRIRELEVQAARDAEVLEALRDAHWKALTCVSMYQKWAEYRDRPSFEERAEKTRAMHEATKRWRDLRDAALAARGEG